MSTRGEVLWEPARDALDRTRMGQFARARGFSGYDELLAWSIEDVEGFWAAFADWAGVRWTTPPSRALARGSRAMPGARWFPGGELNYADHALARAADDPDGIAVIERSQTRDRRELTWAELADQVARCRAGLAARGVGSGDRVVAYAPNIIETLVAFLPTAGLGAVWSSCAPEFGTRSVIDRFSQIEPSVLVAVDGYRYGEKDIDRRAEVDAIAAALPSLQHV